MKKYLIAIDVGDTKADAVLFSDDGEVIARCVDPAGIPFDHGVEKTLQNCKNTIDKLMASANVPVCALYAAIATVEYYYDDFIKAFSEFFGIDKIRIEGDGPCLISGMLGHNDGACMICGTGSSLYIRKGDSYRHIGGGGHLVDSCGSGFSLGRLALQSALRCGDGSSHETVLGKLITEKNGGVSPWAEQTEIYAKGRSFVASFASCVFEARDMGDTVARRIFNTGACDLSDVIFAARKDIGEPFTLVLNGGIFKNYPEYARAVCALAPKDIKVIYSNVPPVYGCAVEAMYDIGLTCDEEFREKFLETYRFYE